MFGVTISALAGRGRQRRETERWRVKGVSYRPSLKRCVLNCLKKNENQVFFLTQNTSRVFNDLRVSFETRLFLFYFILILIKTCGCSALSPALCQNRSITCSGPDVSNQSPLSHIAPKRLKPPNSVQLNYFWIFPYFLGIYCFTCGNLDGPKMSIQLSKHD